MTTGFCFDERTLWHSTGEAVLFLPPGRWVQPPAGGGHAESPETKRRFKNLMDVSGLSRKLVVETAPPATEEALHRIHPGSYLSEFQRLSARKAAFWARNLPLVTAGMRSPPCRRALPSTRWTAF
jgi:acetoin utilization deacetylase AcuC-like enzyme